MVVLKSRGPLLTDNEGAQNCLLQEVRKLRSSGTEFEGCNISLPKQLKSNRHAFHDGMFETRQPKHCRQGRAPPAAEEYYANRTVGIVVLFNHDSIPRLRAHSPFSQDLHMATKFHLGFNIHELCKCNSIVVS